MNTKIKHTTHSRIRAQQRAVNQQMIDDTIEHGEMIRKQGLRFFVVTKKSLYFLHDNQYCDHLKNTVVILNADNSIRTVYKNSNAMKTIKKKSKQLYKKKLDA